ALPFADESFDAVLSTFGVMFTPNQSKAASELVRVTRKGGRIGMANWTAEGFIGQVFKTLGRHMPPPPGVKSPALWGNADALAEMFEGVRNIRIEKKDYVFRYRSFAHFMDVFRTYYGPIHKAFLALGEKGAALEADLDELQRTLNRDSSGGFIVPSEYAEIVITR
ncbi:MAG: methyltransferase domain-containing protein, partial [Silicimonas sp.]|nr:methyltransferase domain-containing protein [Silicimonas sp.]